MENGAMDTLTWDASIPVMSSLLSQMLAPRLFILLYILI